MKSPTRILLIIIVSQFFCTSLWFGGNAVVKDLSNEVALPSSALAHIVASVQLGFITGTLVFALLTLADRFHPSKVFFVSAILAAMANASIVLITDYYTILILRFFTGFVLAGIYPVGMKIAADHFEKGLSNALGFLVGALVLGTSFPHLLKSFSVDMSWKVVLIIISCMAAAGGFFILIFVPSGPFRKRQRKPQFSTAMNVFRNPGFRSSAFGYFGHMWELYTFWAFVPMMISFYNKSNGTELPVSLLSFFTVAGGSVACILAGLLSKKYSSKQIAVTALCLSGACCVLSPFMFAANSIIFSFFLSFWGWMVVADSPMFSGLIAANTIAEEKGTALTISTCIGFLITIISISLTQQLSEVIATKWLFVLLAGGPVLGLYALKSAKR